LGTFKLRLGIYHFAYFPYTQSLLLLTLSIYKSEILNLKKIPSR